MKAEDKRKHNGGHLLKAGKKSQFTTETARAAQRKSATLRGLYAVTRDLAEAVMDEKDLEGVTLREAIVRKCAEKAKAGDVKAMELLTKWAREF